MTEKTKPNEENETAAKKNRKTKLSENPQIEKEKKSDNNPTQGSYYYDDSYGYELYNPDEDDDDD